jgi:hypothetical protein
MRTLKALAIIVAAIMLLFGTRFETYHYQGSFWTLNRYTGRVMRCMPVDPQGRWAGGCEEVGNVSF